MSTSICIIIGGKRSKLVQQQVSKLSADQYIILEGDGRACENLHERFDNELTHIEQCFVSAIGEPSIYYQLDDPRFNALAEPTGLLDLFPNLKLLNKGKVQTIQIVEIIKRYCQPGSGHILVINESAQTKSLLESLLVDNCLTNFSELHVETQRAELYKDYSTPRQIVRFLQDKYFKYASSPFRESDPDFPFLSFTADNMMRLIKEQGSAQHEKINQIGKLSAQHAKIIQENQNSLQISITELMDTAIREIQILKSEVETLKSLVTKDDGLKEDVEKGFTKIGKLTHNQITNATNQLESFMSLQSYLNDGHRPLSFHGWPISPDIGLKLASLIDKNEYDLLIEFGSGTSTVLMAKALSKKYSSKEKVEVPRLLTFEHHPKYFKQTQKTLQDNQLVGYVDLIYAPLIDFKYSEENNYLYYDCSGVLERYARSLKGTSKNILVFVDGPPGSTNEHARFPALTFLLNHLAEHSFTVIMDDYYRLEEKQIVERWIGMLEKRGRPSNFEKISNEKGAAILNF